MKIEMWPISAIKPYPGNPRQNDEAVAKVARSIKEFGWRQPIVVDVDGVIIVGHTRRLAAMLIGREAGWTEEQILESKVPVNIADNLTPEHIRAYRIADNALAEIAQWDDALLEMELRGLKDDGFDLDILGFDEDDLNRHMGITPGATDPDAVPPPPKDPVTKAGDLWVMGNHRLLCGDSTKAEDVGRLMGGELAHLVFTDPPYGVDYDGGTKVREKLAGDGTTMLYDPCCKMAFEFSDNNAPIYLWHAGVKGIAAAAAAAAAAAGYEIRCEIIWNKNLAQFGSLSSQYKQKHEPAYYCFKRGETARWFGPTNEVTVWDVNRAQVNEFHPTQKPTALAERAMCNNSQVGNIVLDLFLGSGATLIAAEQLNRRCFGMEISPAYCDVIVARWEKFTGQKAELEIDSAHPKADNPS